MWDMDCHNCQSYKRGAGSKPCLKCDKYSNILKKSVSRHTIKIDIIPQNLLEALPDHQHNHDMLEALQSIPSDLALLVAGHYLAGIPQRDLAGLMRCSQQAISRRLQLGIVSLKKNIKQ